MGRKEKLEPNNQGMNWISDDCDSGLESQDEGGGADGPSSKRWMIQRASLFRQAHVFPIAKLGTRSYWLPLRVYQTIHHERNLG